MHKTSFVATAAFALTTALCLSVSAQDRGGLAGSVPAARPGDCPPAMGSTGMLASAAQATAPASSATPAATGKKAGFASPRGWSPVGTPGMFTGIDTGVTRGPAGTSASTTGTYGAGSESSSIISIPAGDPADTPTGSAGSSGRVAKDPC